MHSFTAFRLATGARNPDRLILVPKCSLSGNRCGTTRVARNKRVKINVDRNTGQHRRSVAAAAAGDDSKIDGSRTMQVASSKLLAQLLEANDTRRVAQENAEQYDEAFFMVASTYLQMAEKEGNEEVVSQIKGALKIAMEEKNKTLRPEIQLFNRLLAEKERPARKRILNTQESGETLTMNDKYFFSLLDRMLLDVENQPENPSKAGLLAHLKAIKQEANDRLPGASARGFA